MSERTRIKLADGSYVTLKDWREGPLSDAVCSQCSRLAPLIHVRADGKRFCYECAKTKVSS